MSKESCCVELTTSDPRREEDEEKKGNIKEETEIDLSKVKSLFANDLQYDAFCMLPLTNRQKGDLLSFMINEARGE